MRPRSAQQRRRPNQQGHQQKRDDAAIVACARAQHRRGAGSIGGRTTSNVMKTRSLHAPELCSSAYIWPAPGTESDMPALIAVCSGKEASVASGVPPPAQPRAQAAQLRRRRARAAAVATTPAPAPCAAGGGGLWGVGGQQGQQCSAVVDCPRRGPLGTGSRCLVQAGARRLCGDCALHTALHLDGDASGWCTRTSAQPGVRFR